MRYLLFILLFHQFFQIFNNEWRKNERNKNNKKYQFFYIYHRHHLLLQKVNEIKKPPFDIDVRWRPDQLKYSFREYSLNPVSLFFLVRDMINFYMSDRFFIYMKIINTIKRKKI